MRAARIENGLVADLWEVPALDAFGDLYTLVEVPDDVVVVVGANFSGGTFTNPPPPRPTREQQMAQIDKARDAALNAGFTFDGHLFHSDQVFQGQLHAFLLAWATGALAPTATAKIRRKDNVMVDMTQAEVGALAGALMAHVQGIYATSWTAKDALP